MFPKATLYTRAITPEQQKTNKSKLSSKPLKTTQKQQSPKEKMNIAFLNKEIFSDHQRIAAYNLQNESKEKYSKKLNSPTSHIHSNFKEKTYIDEIKEPKSLTSSNEKTLKENNSLFKYLLNNSPAREYDNVNREFYNEFLEPSQKAEIKRTKYVDTLSRNSNEKPYEQLLDQMKEEKKIFYEKLNMLNNCSRNNNFGSPFNDSQISNSENRSKTPQNSLDLHKQILNSSEIEKATLLKLIEELEKNKRKKEYEVSELKETLDKHELELEHMQKNHNDLGQELQENIDDLINENQALDGQLEKARNNAKEQERNYNETQKIIENYKLEISQMSDSLKKKEKKYEKEMALLEIQLSNENNRNEELLMKLGEVKLALKKNDHVKEEFANLNQDLNATNEEVIKLEKKKATLIEKENTFRMESQEILFNLKQNVILKNQEIQKMRGEFEDFCKVKEKLKQNLENEILVLESEINSLQISKEQEKRNLQDRLVKINKENELLEKELKLSEEEHESKLKGIQKELEDLENKSQKLDAEIKDLDEVRKNLQEEINSSKKVFENQLNQISKENDALEKDNKETEESIIFLRKENEKLEKQLNEEKSNIEQALEGEVSSLLKEIDESKYSIEILSKSKLELENEIAEVNKKINDEKLKKNELANQEKDRGKMISKLKSELQDLQKINEQNNSLLKNMLEEKSQYEKELEDLKMTTMVYQKEMEKNLESINEMSEKEAQMNSKIKLLETELKSKKKK